jgi:hypothetical protein
VVAWLGLEDYHVDPQATNGLSAFELNDDIRRLPPLPGPSWWRRLTGDSERRVFASGIAYGPEQVAVRNGAMKSILHLRNDAAELYDLHNDPAELSPVADDGLALEFNTAAGDYLDLPVIYGEGANRELDRDQLDELKSIGYLQGVEDETPAQPDPDTRPPGETANLPQSDQDAPDDYQSDEQ